MIGKQLRKKNATIALNVLYAKNEKYVLHMFQNITQIVTKIYELDLAKLLSSLGLAWQAALKKTKVKLDLLTYINMLLLVEKGIRGAIFYSIYQYVKANNKSMRDYDKLKESSYIQYWDVNN